MLGLHKDKVRVVDYCPDWPMEFETEKRILRGILGDAALAIEHVGSTSVPGLSAKPVLDIAVAVKDAETLSGLIPVLTDAGYDVLNSIETCGEILARKGKPECRTHYVHVEIAGGVYWNDHILFRDYLRRHPDSVKRYEALKKNLAARFPEERKEYTAAKDEFIGNVLKSAEKELTP